jgi:beta-fructofuranosidase
MLAIADQWIWDSWALHDGAHFHLFYLQAPKSLGDPGLRHLNARIGHARSTDLISWEVLPDALSPSASGWDDLATWTGSVVRANGDTWLMFYTAISHGQHGIKDQRIGVVESRDLIEWSRSRTTPVLGVDPRWYETLPDDPNASETWRDPFVYPDPSGTGWRMLISARGIGGKENDNAVLAQAWSPDLRAWEVQEPACGMGHGFGEIEVPQVLFIDGHHVLVFTCHPNKQSPEHIARHGRFATWAVVGESAVGPWDIHAAQPFVAEPDLFAAPLLQRDDGSWSILGFRNVLPESDIAFEICDPIPVTIVEGALVSVL